MEFTLANINEDNFSAMPAGTMPAVRETTTTETSVLFNALNGGSESIKKLLSTGEPISVANIVVTSTDIPSDREDPESELMSKPVVHFMTSDGVHYSTLSNGIIRGIKMLFATGIIPTAEKPLQIVFKTTETKKGIAHTFDIVGGV